MCIFKNDTRRFPINRAVALLQKQNKNFGQWGG